MLKSMTGYGRSERNFDAYTISVELRSVNHRYFDCTIRLPRLYLFVEDAIKTMIQKEISRGKVEVFVTIDGISEVPSKIMVNHTMAKSYCEAFQELAEKYHLDSTVSAFELSKLPDVLTLEQPQEDFSQREEEILGVLSKALEDFAAMRRQEGEKLREDVLFHSKNITDLVKNIEERSPLTVVEYREKLQRRMTEVLNGVPIQEERILTEAAIFADKIAVAEETVRIHSHLEQLEILLQQEGAIGRKLDFLIQEFNRESNTIGSKCNDLEISHWVVDLKAELEKIREQIQNIE